MSMRGTTIRLIIFTLFTVLITTWLATLIGNFKLFSSPYQVQAEFRDASGLLVGDVVKASGVTIGRVSSIEVENGIAVVTMQIQEDVEIPAEVEVAIRFRNLVGQRMVTFTQTESRSQEMLAANTRISFDNTTAAFDLTVLFNGLRPLIRSTSPEDINIVARELVTALKGKDGDVESILSNVADLSDVISSHDKQLSQLLEGLNVVTSDLSGRDQQLKVTLSDMASFLTDLAGAKDDLAAAIDNLDVAAGIFDQIIRDHGDRFSRELDDLAIILDAIKSKRAELKAAVRALPDFAVSVQRASNYGEWGNQHLIHVCKDDAGTCGTRGTP